MSSPPSSPSLRPRAAFDFKSAAFWLLVAVFALEFFLFDHFGARRHTNIYPRWNDQIQYLNEGYTAHEYAREHGFGAGLWHTLTNPSLQGTLHDFFALIAFKIAGPSRSAALALNMLALIAWQAALFVAVMSRVAKTNPIPTSVQPRSHEASFHPAALAFAVATLPLVLCGPWDNIPGSAYDFRLDHLAMCALGVTASIAWMSDGFRSRRPATFFGVAVGVTLLTRFLTGTYFVIIFSGLLVWILFGTDRKLRVANLFRAAFIGFVIAAPVFWMNREAVRDYYWIGHFVGPESAIRNPHMDFWHSLGFVGGNLLQRHIGTFFLALAIFAAAVLAFSRGKERRTTDRSVWIIGGLFLGAPALVLTLHQQKSEVVVSALVPGLLLLMAALWLVAARRAHTQVVRGVAVAIAIGALVFFIRAQVRPAFSPATIADARIVNSIADEISRRARAGGLKEMQVAVDYITDAFDAQVLRVICYERQHILWPTRMTLPTGIAEPTEETVMSLLAESDFVFLSEEATNGLYPYDRKLIEMRPRVRAWCEANLRVANQFTVFGRRMVLYQRREIPFP